MDGNSSNRQAVTSHRARQRIIFALLSIGASLLMVLMVSFAAGFVRSVYAATLTVTNTSDSGAGSLREALVTASAGDTIQFSGLSANSIILLTSGELTVTQEITIDGSTATNLAVDGNNASRVFNVTAPLSIISLTIQHGRVTGDGGGLYTTSALTLTHVSFLTNTATGNGGGAVFGSTANVTATTFTSNTAINGGGAVFGSTANVTATTFTSNTATSGGGGGAYFGSPANVMATTFTGNTAVTVGGGACFIGPANVMATTFTGNTAGSFSGGGGAFFNSTANVMGTTFTSNTAILGVGGGAVFGSTASMTATTFTGNTAGNQGGGAHFYATANVTATTFTGNTATGSGGGASFDLGSTANVTATTFTDNTAGNSGGGLYFGSLSTMNMTATTFTGNTAASAGGGAVFYGTANVMTTTFTSNTAVGSGGGAVFSDSSTANVTATTFTGNTASNGFGGGAYFGASSTANVTATTFTGNTANINGFGGGAYFGAGSTANVTATTFTGNHANVDGGGAYTTGAVTLTGGLFQNNTSFRNGGGLYQSGISDGQLVNALFARNVANGTLGAALYLDSAGSVQILHTTIAGLTASGDSAIFIDNGTVGITDTIVASHSIGINRTAGTVYEDYNLFFGNTVDTGGTIGGGTNDVSGDPIFVDPASDNYHLGADSAAIDVGANAGVTSDFDGDVRPQGFGYDIGYDEVLQYRGGLATNTDYPLLSSPPVTVSFSALGDVNYLAAVYFPRADDHATGTPGHGVGADHFWQIAARNSTGGTATSFTASITVPYNSAIIGSSPVLCFYPGALGGFGWDCTGTQSYDGSTITRAGLTHFSDWAVGNAGPTAITLEQFTAQSSSVAIGFVLILIVRALIGSGWWLRRRTRQAR